MVQDAGAAPADDVAFVRGAPAATMRTRILIGDRALTGRAPGARLGRAPRSHPPHPPARRVRRDLLGPWTDHMRTVTAVRAPVARRSGPPRAASGA